MEKDLTEKAAEAGNLHYERSVLRHVLSTFYIDTGIEGRKIPFRDLPKDDIDNHEIHWWRSTVTESEAPNLQVSCSADSEVTISAAGGSLTTADRGATGVKYLICSDHKLRD